MTDYRCEVCDNISDGLSTYCEWCGNSLPLEHDEEPEEEEKE
jgi:hypothetical protein